jgi:CheY-like chemotaxis protein
MLLSSVEKPIGKQESVAASIRSQDVNESILTRRILAVAQGSEAKILVVDDDEITLASIGDLLQGRGFNVRTACNGAEALSIFEQEWFPLLLTDWCMPVMDGLELTRSLRARGVTDTYVIMLTALGTDLDYERAYEAGVDDYLIKQVPDIELFARLHAGFCTLNLRRALRDAHTALADRPLVAPNEKPSTVPVLAPAYVR